MNSSYSVANIHWKNDLLHIENVLAMHTTDIHRVQACWKVDSSIQLVKNVQLLWNVEVHRRFKKGPTSNSILNQLNPIQTSNPTSPRSV
jgi:hypothetical protein